MDGVEYLTGVAYEAFINLVPESTVRIQDATDIATEVWDIYEEYMENQLGGTRVVYEHDMYFETTKSTRNDSSISSFVLHSKVYFGYSHKYSNQFLNGLLSLEKKEQIFLSQSNSTYKMMLGYYDKAMFIPVPGRANRQYDKLLTRIEGILPEIKIRKPKVRPTLITKVLGCPLIQDDRNSTVSVDEIEYPPGSFITKNVEGNVSVVVCVDDYLYRAAMKYPEPNKHNQSLTDHSLHAKDILTLVCTCMSLLCLILTLITYIMLQELRTQPGINTMALAISLIIAQTLFLFGMGQSKSLPEWNCQAIGVLIHFFWLMVMFWMNVCSIHMFMVFITIDKITVPKNKLKQTILYTIYTILAPATFVIINVVISLRRPDIEGIGYGGNICYITESWMIGYVFSLPVGVTVIVNLSLFVAVLIKMWKMPTVNSETKHTRNLFAIFAKLSTLTGITWILGFAMVFTNIPAFEYLFIIFNASQGVFIFLAFVCNKRVLNLYRGFIARSKTCCTRCLPIEKPQSTNFTNIVQNESH